MWPHGYCLLWDKELIFFHVISNVLTALAYYVVPVILMVLLKRKKIGMVLGSVGFTLLSVFIAACGTHHLFNALTIWYPVYRLQAAIDIVMAVVSVISACYFIYEAPYILSHQTVVEQAQSRLDKLLGKLDDFDRQVLDGSQ